jgi:hypothetical protein
MDIALQTAIDKDIKNFIGTAPLLKGWGEPRGRVCGMMTVGLGATVAAPAHEVQLNEV